MDENRINALIQLLDDTDEEVVQSVHNELLRLGKDYYYYLKKRYEYQQDDVLRARLGSILLELQGGVVTDKILQWRKDGGESLLEGWALVSQYFYPTLDPLEYKKKISNWVHQIWLKTHPRMKIEEKVKIVLNFLKNSLNFSFQPSEELLNPDFLFLHYVIERRKGNTLSLSLLLNILFHQLEIYTHIVSFEGYYAIRYLDHHQHFYIDVFNIEQLFNENDVKLFLIRLNLDNNLLHYKPISNIYLILTLLNQAKTLFLKHNNHEQYKRTEELLQNIDIKFL